MNKSVSRLITVLVVVALGAGAYYWWQSRQPSRIVATEVAAPVVVAPVEVASAPLSVALPAPAASAASAPMTPLIEFPVQAIEQTGAASAPTLPALINTQDEVNEALNGLLGRNHVLTFLQLDKFARRVVATVDNLARSHAPLTLWPVNPTPGRFATLAEDGREVISPDNDLRYTPLILFIESVNTNQAVALYVRLYPLFQQAYEDIGFPGHYFNDRFVTVLDHLLSTPVQSGPIGVELVEVKGPYPSLRPWVRYEFTDPALQALTSGQKMLVRSGPVNHRRLNSKMLELRTLIAGAALPRTTDAAQVQPQPQPESPPPLPVIRY